MVKRLSVNGIGLLATIPQIVPGENIPQRPEQTVETVKLYFADEDNERLVTERRLQSKRGRQVHRRPESFAQGSQR